MNKLPMLLLGATFAASPCMVLAEEIAKQQVDISDPMAVYTGGAITGGNEGLGGAFQFGMHKGDWGLLGKIEAKKNLDAFRTRLFTPNKNTGTGVFIDAGTDSSIDGITSNYATVGVLQVVPLAKNLRLYAGLTYGKSWEKNDYFQETKIAIAQTYLKYDINKDFYIMLNPQYTYGFDGEETRNFFMEFNFGYHIDATQLVYLETSTENAVVLNYKFKI
ncbi:hypothetical protein [Colwellia sp. 12G3]|uniref:hypothetical protein n=1 Tax=Colwellia sp. 12G3 TaxID=2058299 RepID=UPI000C34042C|nr:hypothetical protein [Colwellia sp. 12G3]PKI16360.1 hypothetical protein CXF71_09105 [Colwellia sp. 12G3]